MRLTPSTVLLLLAVLVAPAPALAYMGPGLGLGAAGTALGLVAAVLLGLFSILWYPCKRLVRRALGRGRR